jgi:hypothetical protein
MAFDFPSSPVVDQVYTDNGVTYVWNGYGWQTGTGGSEIGLYVLKTGDTMSGPLSIPEPTASAHAATKQYVDSAIAAALP